MRADLPIGKASSRTRSIITPEMRLEKIKKAQARLEKDWVRMVGQVKALLKQRNGLTIDRFLRAIGMKPVRPTAKETTWRIEVAAVCNLLRHERVIHIQKTYPLLRDCAFQIYAYGTQPPLNMTARSPSSKIRAKGSTRSVNPFAEPKICWSDRAVAIKCAALDALRSAQDGLSLPDLEFAVYRSIGKHDYKNLVRVARWLWLRSGGAIERIETGTNSQGLSKYRWVGGDESICPREDVFWLLSEIEDRSCGDLWNLANKERSRMYSLREFEQAIAEWVDLGVCQQKNFFSYRLSPPAVADLLVGDWVVELPGTPSERYGCVRSFEVHHQLEGVFPVVCWANSKGGDSFANPEMLYRIRDDSKVLKRLKGDRRWFQSVQSNQEGCNAG